MKRHYVFAAAALAVACSTPSASQEQSAKASEDEPLTRVSPGLQSDEVEEDTASPIRLDVSGERADWLVENTGERRPPGFSDSVVGASCGLHVHFEERKSVLVYCLGDDLPHVVRAIPGTNMVRFGRDDALLAFTDDRRMLRWNADEEKWIVRNGALPTAKFTDATGRFAVVASESGAWVSTDEGKSFAPLPAVEDATVSTALVRPDGLVVLQATAGGNPIALTAREPYAEWARIEGATPPMSRKGAWVTRRGANWVLAKDGRTWVSPAYPTQDTWNEYLYTYTSGRPVAHAGIPRWTTQQPAAPSKDVKDSDGSGQGYGRIGGLGKCSGLGCLADYPTTPPSHISYTLVGQFMCDKDAKTVVNDECMVSSEIVHTPAQTVRNRDAGTFVALQRAEPWMKSVKFHSYGGLGIAAEQIGKNKTRYRVADTSLDWKTEMTLEGKGIRFTQVMFADDGTMLLVDKERDSGKAWIRPRAEPGGVDGWMQLAVEDVAFYRPLPGGEALAVLDRTKDVEQPEEIVVGFVHVDRDGSQRVIIDDVRLTDVTGKTILIDAEGRISLAKNPSSRSDEQVVPRVLYDDGTWREVSPTR